MTLPDLPEAFYWTQSSCGLVLKCRPLDTVARHVFTTRELQLPSPGAWEKVSDALGVRRVATLNQVHGNTVVPIRRDTAPPVEVCSGDGLVSDDPDVAIAVRAADCVPLLLADPTTGAVAAVHAGWRGTAASAAVAGVETLTRECGAIPDDMVAAIGPSIGACCYEVGSELVDAFAAAGHPRHLIDRWFVTPPPRRGARRVPATALKLDVAGANRDQLVLAGVRPENIFACGLCTAEHLGLLTSYRIEKEKAVRLAGAIAPARRL